MPLTIPSHDQIVASIIADVQSSVRISVGGQLVAPTFSVGSVNLALADFVALVLYSFYGQLDQVDRGLRLSSAQGSDLDDLVALVNAQRTQGTQAAVPVKFTRYFGSASPYIIPTGTVVLATDAQGNPTLSFIARQDPTQAVGVAGQIAQGANDGWAWCDASDVGAAYNVAAGAIALLGTPLAGVDAVGNPQVPNPSAPVATPTGGATTTRYYKVVAHGVYGSTLPSTTTTLTTGPTTLDGTHYVTLTWTAQTDAAGYDVLVSTDQSTWYLVGSTAASVTTLVHNAAATTVYTLPSTNTTNEGTGGADLETDDALRARAPLSIAVQSASTALAIRGALLAISGIARVFVSDASPGTVAVVYTTADGNPVSTATAALINTAVQNTKAAGVAYTVAMATTQTIAVAYTFHAQTGVTGSTLITAINSAITAYFGGLSLGDPVRWSQVTAAIIQVAGVAAVSSVTLDTLAANTDVAGIVGTLFVPGLFTATVN